MKATTIRDRIDHTNTFVRAQFNRVKHAVRGTVADPDNGLFPADIALNRRLRSGVRVIGPNQISLIGRIINGA